MDGVPAILVLFKGSRLADPPLATRHFASLVLVLAQRPLYEQMHIKTCNTVFGLFVTIMSGMCRGCRMGCSWDEDGGSKGTKLECGRRGNLEEEEVEESRNVVFFMSSRLVLQTTGRLCSASAGGHHGVQTSADWPSACARRS